MSEPTIYALKIDEDNAQLVHASLLLGEARFGWSYIERADLRELQARANEAGWDSLSEDEQECYQEFLLGIEPGDYLVYVNVPEWGQCTLAKATSPYYWKHTDPDFNHRLGVDPRSVRTFDRNDAVVHPALSARLKLQGRWWRVYATDEFAQLLAALDGGARRQKPKGQKNLDFLSEEVRPLLLKITEAIHHAHPNYSLEHLLTAVLRNVPGVKDVRCQGGAGDRGADIVAVLEQGHPLTGVRQSTCVIQVKSFEGEHWDTRAVEDIRRAFKAYPEADSGLIISTASKSGPTFDAALEKLRSETKKHVGVLMGGDLAIFVLRYGAHLFTEGRETDPAAT